MLSGKKIIVVLPAYNAEKTLEATYAKIPFDIVDDVILVDDCSSDKTLEVARRLNIDVISHPKNLGYGGNQKTCYTEALKRGGDIIVMVHPDYQYPPQLVTGMAALISSGMFDVVLGSRILGGYALKGGMPVYKYIANRALTFLQNLATGQKLSEYHTGFRAYSRDVLKKIPFMQNSNDFVFDNQILTQAFYFNFQIGEITARCSYNQDCSSINFRRSMTYGWGVLENSLKYILQKQELGRYKIYEEA